MYLLSILLRHGHSQVCIAATYNDQLLASSLAKAILIIHALHCKAPTHDLHLVYRAQGDPSFQSTCQMPQL